MSNKEAQYASDDQAYQTDMHYARKETKMRTLNKKEREIVSEWILTKSDYPYKELDHLLDGESRSQWKEVLESKEIITKMSKKIEKRHVLDDTLEWEESSIDDLVHYYFDDNKTANEAIKILNDEGILENRFGSQWRIKAG